MTRGVLVTACAGSFALAACGGGNGTSSAVDGATGGMCSADVPPGQACNAIAPGAGVPPTCATGTTPTGQGGTIVDGTYVLTAETYYNYPGSTCPTFSVNGTIQIAGNCMQAATSSPIPLTVSGIFVVVGNGFSSTQTCLHTDLEGGTTSSPTETFTATATTLTFFLHEPAGNPDIVSAYTKQ